MKPVFFLYAAFLLGAQTVWAGVFEIGAAVNYRKSSIDSNNYQESASYTGTLSYYFINMSAIELSYTNGSAQTVVQPPGDTRVKTVWDFTMIGLDLVFTLSPPDTFVQPFVKIGAAYIDKTAVQQADGLAAEDVPAQKGFVPSAGLGFKMNLTRQFGIKVGIDAWTTPLSDHTMIIDYAGRAGLSWTF